MSTDYVKGAPAKRTMVATVRKNKRETIILHDELPPLQPDEIRMRVDRVGLSANNMFYAQMGEAPFLKFFHVYPIEGHEALANMPAWGSATVIESENPQFKVGEQFRGFLHLTNVVQMKAERTEDGFRAYGGNRDKLNSAYNLFTSVADNADSAFHGDGAQADLAMVSAPGALSGFMLCELMRSKNFYGGDAVVLTSASSKLSMATAFLLKAERDNGTLQRIVGYTSKGNLEFVRSTGLFDEVLTYDESLPSEVQAGVLIDVAGDATIFKRIKPQLAKALAVGGTHVNAKASTFAAFGPTGILKMVGGMAAPRRIANWLDDKLDPKLEMFFAPTVSYQLLERWGREVMNQKLDEAITSFVHAALDQGWLSVVRAEKHEDIQAQYRRIVDGTVPPYEGVVLSLSIEKPRPLTLRPQPTA